MTRRVIAPGSLGKTLAFTVFAAPHHHGRCHGVNFSQLNLTQCGSLVPTRLSLTSPFHSCFPTTMCFAHSRRFSHSPRRRQQVNTSNTSNTSTLEFYKNPSQPLFISSTKEYTKWCVLCTNRMLHSRGLAAYL